jgi:hypothetical protein
MHPGPKNSQTANPSRLTRTVLPGQFRPPDVKATDRLHTGAWRTTGNVAPRSSAHGVPARRATKDCAGVTP